MPPARWVVLCAIIPIFEARNLEHYWINKTGVNTFEKIIRWENKLTKCSSFLLSRSFHLLPSAPVIKLFAAILFHWLTTKRARRKYKSYIILQISLNIKLFDITKLNKIVFLKRDILYEMNTKSLPNFTPYSYNLWISEQRLPLWENKKLHTRTISIQIYVGMA